MSFLETPQGDSDKLQNVELFQIFCNKLYFGASGIPTGMERSEKCNL